MVTSTTMETSTKIRVFRDTYSSSLLESHVNDWLKRNPQVIVINTTMAVTKKDHEDRNGYNEYFLTLTYRE